MSRVKLYKKCITSTKHVRKMLINSNVVDMHHYQYVFSQFKKNYNIKNIFEFLKNVFKKFKKL